MKKFNKMQQNYFQKRKKKQVGQVGEGIEQYSESEVKRKLLFDEEVQQEVFEPKDKPIKENVP